MLTVRPTQKNEVHTHYEVFLDGANIGHLCVLDKDAKFIEGAFAPTYDPDLCPDEIVRSLKRYVESGIRPGSFLYAVLCNDLFAAMCQADSHNQHLVGHILSYCYQKLDSEIWGWFVRVANHLERMRGTDP